jgi:hypothetical protein
VHASSNVRRNRDDTGTQKEGRMRKPGMGKGLPNPLSGNCDDGKGGMHTFR